MTVEYRRDGWPLCPRCGADELMSTDALGIFAQPTDPMLCLSCGWVGQVPALNLQAHPAGGSSMANQNPSGTNPGGGGTNPAPGGGTNPAPGGTKPTTNPGGTQPGGGTSPSGNPDRDR